MKIFRRPTIFQDEITFVLWNNIHKISNNQTDQMSDRSQKKNSKKTKQPQPQDLRQIVAEEWNKFTKNIPDVINSVPWDWENIKQKAKAVRDKLMEVYQESKNHKDVALLGLCMGFSAIILAYLCTRCFRYLFHLT